MPAAGASKRRRGADLQEDDGVGRVEARRQRSPPRRAPRRQASTDEDGDEDEDGPGADESFAGDAPESQDATGTQQLVKKLVRLALACEYSRQPIRRTEIGLKVLGPHARRFKEIFQLAQQELREVFGMTMVELPLREKVTISQRRAAQRADHGPTSSKSYTLTSVLPEKFRHQDGILAPPRVPTSQTEATYIGLYTFIVSVISLSGGNLSESKLERYLQRANAEPYTPLDKTDKLLQRLCKDGYLVRVKDSSTGDDAVEYMVGPRGKTEVGTDGVTGLVQTVYRDRPIEDLDARLRRSLGLEHSRPPPRQTADDDTDRRAVATGTSPRTTRPPVRRSTTSRQPTAPDDDDTEADQDGNGDDDE